MNAIGERIKHIRKDFLHKTQRDFGSQIGLKPNSVSDIENGKNNPTDTVIRSICREFDINEEWIRLGSGDMTISPSVRFSKYIGEISKSDDVFIKDLIEVYMELDQNSKDALRLIAEKMSEKIKDRG